MSGDSTASPAPERAAAEPPVVRAPAPVEARAVDLLLDRARREGAPLIDPHPVDARLRRVTFLYEDPTGRHGHVHLDANRVTDKHAHPLGDMVRPPGARGWVVTLDLPATTRFSYGFTVSDAPVRPTGPPRGLPLLDPLNPAPPLRREGGRGHSIFSGDLAEDQHEWHPHTPATAVGAAERHEYTPTGDREPRGLWLWVPPPAPTPPPLLVVTDAEIWFRHLDLPRALAAAHHAGALPEIAVLGVENRDRPDRIATLSPDSGFVDVLAHELLPWAQDRLAHEGVEPAPAHQRIMCGQSLGGLTALCAILDTPWAFGSVVAHSPSLWWRPGGGCSPRDLASDLPSWITERFAWEPTGAARLELDVGSREGPSVPRMRELDEVVRGRGWDSRMRVYDGGHDFATWRGALIHGLRSLLSPLRPGSPPRTVER